MKPKDYSGKIYNLLDELVGLLATQDVEFATQQDIDECTDNIYDCPFQNRVGKHGDNTTYYVFRIKDGVACGVELENNNIYEFKISELDSDCVLQIANSIG